MPFATTCVDAGFQTLRDVPEVTVDQCTAGSFQLVLRDPTGAPIDLTQWGIYAASSSSSGAEFTGVRMVVKELQSDATDWATVNAAVIDAANGLVEVDYDDVPLTRRCGVFIAEMQAIEDGVRKKIYPFYYIVNPSLSGDPAHDNQALSIAEIRMSMRDVDPQSTFLIDELDFKTNEIALMIRRCVDYWNETPPPVGIFKATNFPYRFHLSIGVIGQLHRRASIAKMRNNLDYAAGGITVADTIKWKQYAELGDKFWDQWTQWVKDKKYQINIEGGFGQLNSGYWRTYYWGAYR